MRSSVGPLLRRKPREPRESDSAHGLVRASRISVEISGYCWTQIAEACTRSSIVVRGSGSCASAFAQVRRSIQGAKRSEIASTRPATRSKTGPRGRREADWDSCRDRSRASRRIGCASRERLLPIVRCRGGYVRRGGVRCDRPSGSTPCLRAADGRGGAGGADHTRKRLGHHPRQSASRRTGDGRATRRWKERT